MEVFVYVYGEDGEVWSVGAVPWLLPLPTVSGDHTLDEPQTQENSVGLWLCVLYSADQWSISTQFVSLSLYWHVNDLCTYSYYCHRFIYDIFMKFFLFFCCKKSLNMKTIFHRLQTCSFDIYLCFHWCSTCTPVSWIISLATICIVVPFYCYVWMRVLVNNVYDVSDCIYMLNKCALLLESILQISSSLLHSYILGMHLYIRQFECKKFYIN